jgi:hypothetical protein
MLSQPPVTPTAWAVTEVDGQVNLGPQRATVSARINTGQRLTTGAESRVSVENEDFGQVDLDPESKLRVVGSKRGRQHMSLERGRLHAFIWAPPQQFVVDTPSARAVDLGCEYYLSVDDAGNGYLTVEMGWVAFQFRNQESFIPAGAACRTRRGRGPGIPFYQDAPAAFRDALERYESTLDPAALNGILATARAEDALTLWHLLTRVAAFQRGTVFDRFAQLVKLPPHVDRARALAGDRDMLDLCWNALELDDADWWREWKSEWKPQ